MQPPTKIRRKPPPPIDPDVELDVRYPTPDPSDPFAPLWLLRSRRSNNSLKDTPSPSVVFPLIHDHASSTTSESSATTDTDNHPKWHKRLLSRTRTPIPPSSSSSSSFVHVSSTSDVASEWALPTPAQLARAASLPVIAASGLRVPFASLFATCPTIVVFIRHFWCPHCQDYVSSIAQTVPRPSEKAPFNLIVISNGAPAYIAKYRALFGLEFDMYTDPTLAVYTALGMGQSSSASAQSGDYVRHGTMSGMAMVVLRALKAGLPVWERGGELHQLGGEFVFGPGLSCTYAHRMQSPKGHAPIRAVLSAAGIDISPSPSPNTPKLLAAFRNKSWAPQKRSSSFCLTQTTTTTTAKTPPISTRFKFKRKNMSTGTYPILGAPSPMFDAGAEGTPLRTESPSPISEFGMWRRTGRVSLDSSRVLSEGARTHPHSLPYHHHHHHHHAHTSPVYPSAHPYQHQHQHRQYASTATLPVFTSVSHSAMEEGAGHGLHVKDEDEWMHARMRSLEAMRERKRERRAGFVGYYVPAGGGVGGDVPKKRLGSAGGRSRSSTVGCEPVKEAEEEVEG